MLTGEIRSKIDRIWDAFWSGGISNPLEVIEQITYLLFLKRLDELETAEELKLTREKNAAVKLFFPKGKDSKKRSYQDYRWKNFKNLEPRDMYTVISEHVFPWLRTLGGNGTTYSKHMEGARFTIPTPALLAKVVDMIDKVPMEDRDTKGDLYEYMLGKIASAGQNGQFRLRVTSSGSWWRWLSPSPRTLSAILPAAPAASLSRSESRCANATLKCSPMPSCASTSITNFSTALTSTTPCSASAA
jgi:type I restriction-modification system DNA methylase subunit